MKETSVVKEIIKAFLTIFIGWLLWVAIFSTLPARPNGEVDPFPGASTILGILTGIVIFMSIKYNAIQEAFQNTKSEYNNILIIEEKNERLLQKANEIVDKYMNYEERVQLGIAKERTAKKIVIKDSNQFQTVLENYPDLKANEGMRELLTQIREGENAYMFQKMRYNTVVEQHNFLIHSFPGCFLTLIFKLKDAEFYGRSNEVNKYSNDEFDMIGD